jgi:hypothetical protein
MKTRLTPLLALMLTLMLSASCGAAVPPKDTTPVRIQFAFFHFKSDTVRVTVNGKSVFDRKVTVARDNARYGLAAVAQITIPACSDIVVTTKTQRTAKRLCLTAASKSVVIDGGPPLTITAKDQYQGAD